MQKATLLLSITPSPTHTSTSLPPVLVETAGRLRRFMDALDKIFAPLSPSGHVFILTHMLLKGSGQSFHVCLVLLIQWKLPESSVSLHHQAGTEAAIVLWL